VAQSFSARIYTPADLGDPDSFARLWRLLGDPAVGAHHFDSVERARRPFKSESQEAALELFEDEGMLFVRGADDFTAMFTDGMEGVAVWNFWWDVKVMMGAKRDSWLAWIYRLSRELSLYYGFGCPVAEYSAKHTVVEQVPGGTATGETGGSHDDFFRYLPGLYWLTLFGPELVAHFGAKLDNLPESSVVELDGSRAVLLNGSVIPENMEDRLRLQARWASHLGADHFFDRERPKDDLKPVPTLVAAINRRRSS
jgi:hypothetical protein